MSDVPLKAGLLSELRRLPRPAGDAYPQGTPFVQALAHGRLSRLGVELFAPATAGLGRDGQTVGVQACDIFVVPAGASHRFENFNPNFCYQGPVLRYC